MIRLVSLEQASNHLRRDTIDDDSDLLDKIEAASRAVLNYIDDKDFLDSDGQIDYESSGEPIGVPAPIQSAVLLIVGDLYTDRDQQNFREGGNYERTGRVLFSRTVHFLLDPYRTPRIG